MNFSSFQTSSNVITINHYTDRIFVYTSIFFYENMYEICSLKILLTTFCSIRLLIQLLFKGSWVQRRVFSIFQAATAAKLLIFPFAIFRLNRIFWDIVIYIWQFSQIQKQSSDKELNKAQLLSNLLNILVSTNDNSKV